MTKDPRIYLVQIVECADRILDFTAAGESRFRSDVMVQAAVIRMFQVMGEAAKRVPDDFRSAHPSVPWRQMASFRDVLVHDYEAVDLDLVWAVIEKDLKSTRSRVKELLPPMSELERDIDGEDPPATT